MRGAKLAAAVVVVVGFVACELEEMEMDGNRDVSGVAVVPAYSGAGTALYFDTGTVPTAQWANHVTRELENILTLFGDVFDPLDDSQIADHMADRLILLDGSGDCEAPGDRNVVGKFTIATDKFTVEEITGSISSKGSAYIYGDVDADGQLFLAERAHPADGIDLPASMQDDEAVAVPIAAGGSVTAAVYNARIDTDSHVLVNLQEATGGTVVLGLVAVADGSFTYSVYNLHAANSCTACTLRYVIVSNPKDA
jgi:hypothetical protein